MAKRERQIASLEGMLNEAQLDFASILQVGEGPDEGIFLFGGV